MMLFGEKSSFAIDFLGQEGGLEIADIYIADRNVTRIDNAHYNFISTLEFSAVEAIKSDDLLESDIPLPGDSLEQRCNQIMDDEVRFNYQALDWGPPTDGFFAIIIPFKGNIYLCALLYDEGQTISIKITGVELANTMSAAAKYITNQASETQQSCAPS